MKERKDPAEGDWDIKKIAGETSGKYGGRRSGGRSRLLAVYSSLRRASGTGRAVRQPLQLRAQAGETWRRVGGGEEGASRVFSGGQRGRRPPHCCSTDMLWRMAAAGTWQRLHALAPTARSRGLCERAISLERARAGCWPWQSALHGCKVPAAPQAARCPCGQDQRAEAVGASLQRHDFRGPPRFRTHGVPVRRCGRPMRPRTGHTAPSPSAKITGLADRGAGIEASCHRQLHRKTTARTSQLAWARACILRVGSEVLK